MKTRLLKRLRGDAYRAYGIKAYYHTNSGGDVYIVGLRGYQGDKDVAEFSLKEAKKQLGKVRNEYCMKRVLEMRSAKYCKI